MAYKGKNSLVSSIHQLKENSVFFYYSQHSDIRCADFSHQAVLQFSVDTDCMSYNLPPF